jgi:hypothetical protein
MKGFLPIYEIDESPDWNKTGYFNNWRTGLILCGSTYLLPFKFNKIIVTSPLPTVSQFSIRRIKIVNETKTIKSTTDLNTSLILSVTGGTGGFSIKYFMANVDQASLGLDPGIYEYYILFSDLSEYISAPFKYEACALIGCQGDYNDDFNNDFLICGS